MNAMNPVGHGPALFCEIAGGSAKFRLGLDTKWSPMETARFSLRSGESVRVPVYRANRDKHQTAFFASFVGNRQLEFCPDMDSEHKECRTYPVGRGSSNTPFELPSTITSASLTCRFEGGKRR